MRGALSVNVSADDLATIIETTDECVSDIRKREEVISNRQSVIGRRPKTTGRSGLMEVGDEQDVAVAFVGAGIQHPLAIRRDGKPLRATD